MRISQQGGEEVRQSRLTGLFSSGPRVTTEKAQSKDLVFNLFFFFYKTNLFELKAVFIIIVF